LKEKSFNLKTNTYIIVNFDIKIFVINHVSAEAVITGRIILSGTNSPPADVSPSLSIYGLSSPNALFKRSMFLRQQPQPPTGCYKQI
jgi:hypothetical protein